MAAFPQSVSLNPAAAAACTARRRASPTWVISEIRTMDWEFKFERPKERATLLPPNDCDSRSCTGSRFDLKLIDEALGA